jgi:DNA-binding MarR family transcriptional regulator
MSSGTDNELVEQLFHLNRAEQSYVQRELKQFGLNILQSRTLHFIARHPGAIQKELSRYLSKQEATTTNILKVLEARQLIVRQVPASNERQKQLYLLPAGQELVQSVHGVFVGLEQRISVPLTATEKDTLVQLLQRLNEQADLD